jgi:hypothetical protein
MVELYAFHLSTEGGVSSCTYPIDQATLRATTIGAMIPEALRLVHCEGWGVYGDTEAILTIDQDVGGLYYWSGVGVLEGGLPVPSVDLENFTTYLIGLLLDPNRDQAQLEGTLLDPFGFGAMDSELQFMSPADAMVELYEWHLSTEGGVAECVPGEEVEFQDLPLGGMVPEASRLVFCRGWGTYGDTQAVLTIDQGADGLYYWSSVSVIEIFGFICC